MKRSIRQLTSRTNQNRRGATLVETAVVLPVFLLFVFAMWEFTHAYMVVNILNSAATKAARLGVSQDVTTQDASDLANDIIGNAFLASSATVLVKDASIFDDTNVTPDTIDYTSLPNIELSDADPQQLFVIHISVPYDSVAIMPPFWAKNLTLHGQSVMRHE